MNERESAASGHQGIKRKVPATDKKGSQIVVGTGIRTVGQLTVEAIAWMQVADRVLYLVGDPIAEVMIHRLNPDAAESMADYYEEGQPRIDAYNRMVERILRAVRARETTVGAFYGHPGVFAYPSHESIRSARAEGYSAKMLPGVSAEDCLFADLGVDLAVGGCQSYEATDFMLNGPVIDPSSQLILWQIGTLGDWTYQTRQYDTRSMPMLVQRLAQFYPLTHVITVYEAAMFPGTEPVIDQIQLHALAYFPVTAAKTLYVPPAQGRGQNMAMAGWQVMASGYPWGR